MHMADALISPATGGALWVATGATAVYCAKKVREELDESKIPLMGVAGAFIFAAQMLNFTIPGTGSSGHLGGGLILTILLGPYAAFLVMASVLGVQALFFADGGLLALGANVVNLGFFPAFIAYPLVYKKIVGDMADRPGNARILAGSVLGAVVGLQLGALGVVLETWLSGVSELPLGTFLLMMQPIHLAIGVVEGLVTAGVIIFVRNAQPEILERAESGRSLRGVAMRPVLIGLVIAALASGAAFSWFASTNADGLEWSMERVAGSAEIEGKSGSSVHESLAAAQEKTALLPEYGLPAGETAAEDEGEAAAAWPAVDTGTSIAGVVGAAITLAVAAAIGLLLKRRSTRRRDSSATIGM